MAEVRASQVKINPKWENDQLSMEIVVRLFLDLHELGFEVFDYSQTDLKRFLEEAFARQMKSDIEHLLNTVQKDLKLDIIGFGSMTKKKVPQAWRKLGGKNGRVSFRRSRDGTCICPDYRNWHSCQTHNSEVLECLQQLERCWFSLWWELSNPSCGKKGARLR